MNKQDVQYLLDAKIGSSASVYGKVSKVIGKFYEIYTPDGEAEPYDVYVLALNGGMMVGVEYTNRLWRVWYGGFVENKQITSLEEEMNSMREAMGDVETGTIEGIHSQGDGCNYYPIYAFGGKASGGLWGFLGINENGYDTLFLRDVYRPLEDIVMS